MQVPFLPSLDNRCSKTGQRLRAHLHLLHTFPLNSGLFGQRECESTAGFRDKKAQNLVITYGTREPPPSGGSTFEVVNISEAGLFWKLGEKWKTYSSVSRVFTFLQLCRKKVWMMVLHHVVYQCDDLEYEESLLGHSLLKVPTDSTIFSSWRGVGPFTLRHKRVA